MKRTPGGRVVVHYTKPNHKVQKCAQCGKDLHGVPRKSTLKQTASKSERRPSRPYAGVLCSRCSRELIKGVTNA
jgi:large subunit ribosomal protein L34e